MSLQIRGAVQAGTPMTVTGETLPSLGGAGYFCLGFICSKISRGPGQRPGTANTLEPRA